VTAAALLAAWALPAAAAADIHVDGQGDGGEQVLSSPITVGRLYWASFSDR
jgi:hypothetical protein